MTDKAHLACPNEEDCGSSDAYSHNFNKGIGYCHSCGIGTWVFNGKLYGKYSNQGKSIKLNGDVAKDICSESSNKASNVNSYNKDPWAYEDDDKGSEEEVIDYMNKDTKDTSSKGEYVARRGIAAKTMEFYGVKNYGNEEHYVYPSGGVKVRKFPKDFVAKNGFKGDELFGMNLFPAGCAKVVTICEGETDSLSAYQMLSANNSYVNPVVSVPSAKPSGKLWEKCKGWLDSFDKIIVSADNDEVGQKLPETLFDLFPTKVFVMDHGKHKDANDFLQAGEAKDYKSAWWAAKRYSPAGFTSTVEDWLRVLDEETPYEYVETPVEDFNKVARGLVKGGITVLKAPPGSGKSSLLRFFQHDQVMNKGQKVAVLMMEEVKSITGRAMATYQLGKNVMTREDAKWNDVSEEEVKEALRQVVGEEHFVSFEVNPQDPINDTLAKCQQAIAFFGVDYIYIDHLQRLAYLAGTDGATANLTELGVKLTELAKRKNVGIIPISHVNEDGHTKYAKAIEEEAIVLIELSRNKEADTLNERNTSYLTVTKNRPFGSTGPAGALIYDPATTILKAKEGVKEPEIKRQDKEDIPF